MAITVTARGTAASNASSSTTYAFSPGSNFAAGSLAVLVISADNASTGGSSNDVNSVTDSLGNTWTKRIGPIFDNGAASAGIQGAIFDCKQEVGVLTTGATITVTFGASTTAKSYALWQLASAAGTQAAYQTSATATGSATASPTVTTSSLTNGDAVVGVIAGEAGTTQTHTADADTTNGSWSAAQYSEVGSTTSGNVIASQVKVVTATATQTYNPTFGLSQDSLAFWASYRETANTQTVTLDVIDAGSAIYAPSLVPPVQSVTLGVIDAGSAIYAPTVRRIEPDAYGRRIVNDAPVAYYRMGDTGSVLYDVMRNHDGAYVGTVTQGVAGVPATYDDAIELDGSGAGYAEVSGWTSQPAAPASVEAWISHDALTFTGVDVTIAGFYNAGTRALRLMAFEFDADTLSIGIYTEGGNAHYDWTVPNTSMHHIVGVIASGGGTATFYLDGTQVATAGISYPGAGTTEAFRIGTGTDLGVEGTQSWPGRIDEVAVYDYALTGTQILDHYNEGVAAGSPQTVTLGVIDAGSAIYAPTLVGKNAVVLGLIDAGSAIYAPTLVGKNTVTLGLIDAGSAIYAPTLVGKNAVVLGLIDAGSAIYAPTLATVNTIALGLIDAGSAIYAPTVAGTGGAVQSVTLGLIDAGSAIYAPTLVGKNGIVLGLIDAGSAIYAPTLVGKNAIVLGLIDAGSAIYAPTVTRYNGITVPLIDAGSAIYAPIISTTGPQTVTLGLIDAGRAVYALVITQSLTVGGDPLEMRGGKYQKRYPWAYKGLKHVR